MKTIQYRSCGNYTENRFVDLPQPALRNGEVLVAMRTVGINPLDNTFRSGHFYGAMRENLPRIGGQTGASAIVARKSDAFSVGDCVPGFGIMTDGTVLQYSIGGSMKWTCSPCGKDTCFMVGGSYWRVDWLQS